VQNLNARDKHGLIKRPEIRFAKRSPEVSEKLALQIQKHKQKETWQTVLILNLPLPQHVRKKQERSMMTQRKGARVRIVLRRSKRFLKMILKNANVEMLHKMSTIWQLRSVE
jgi:hypothetical protein